MFIPVIASAVTAGTIWRIILSTDGGILNNILGVFGIDPVNWLGSTSTSLVSICIVAVWKNVGYFLVIYYAGIMGIPRDLYEAARVDGATTIQQFTKITLPMLKPITYLVVTLGIIWSFQVFDLSYQMTGGGPGHSSVTLVMSIYIPPSNSTVWAMPVRRPCSFWLSLLSLTCWKTCFSRRRRRPDSYGKDEKTEKLDGAVRDWPADPDSFRGDLYCAVCLHGVYVLHPVHHADAASGGCKLTDFSNFEYVLGRDGFLRALMNSAIVVVCSCLFNCIVSSMAAYGFAKKRFPGRDAIYRIYLMTLMIPGQVTMIPVSS